MVSENLSTFRHKDVVDYNSETGIENLANAYRLRISYDDFEEDKSVEDLLVQFCNDPKATEVEELIIGIWDYEGGSSKELVEALIEQKDKLPKLTHLMFGDITYHENEISWIEQGDVTPILKAYPNLEHFQVRGGNGLKFSPISHPNLKTLIVETGGLPSKTVKEIFNLDLPNLEHFEIWMGDDNYGFDGSVEDYTDLLSGKLYPKLKTLGLRNSKISDDLAKASKGAAIIDRIEVLDFSMGTMGDEGAQALLDNPKVKNLKSLNLRHHYMSEEMMEKLKDLGIEVNVDEQEEPEEEDYRYVEVAE